MKIEDIFTLFSIILFFISSCLFKALINSFSSEEESFRIGKLLSFFKLVSCSFISCLFFSFSSLYFSSIWFNLVSISLFWFFNFSISLSLLFAICVICSFCELKLISSSCIFDSYVVYFLATLIYLFGSNILSTNKTYKKGKKIAGMKPKAEDLGIYIIELKSVIRK